MQKLSLTVFEAFLKGIYQKSKTKDTKEFSEKN